MIWSFRAEVQEERYYAQYERQLMRVASGRFSSWYLFLWDRNVRLEMKQQTSLVCVLA